MPSGCSDRAPGGEDVGEHSDVDVLVLVDDDSWPAKERIRGLLRSFFIGEVDRHSR